MDSASPELFRVIADYTYDWETWVDQRGKTRWVNPAVTRITGYEVAECLGHEDYPVVFARVEDRPLLARVLADAASGGSGNDVEFRICRKDQRVVWVAISWQPVRTDDGSRLGYRTSVRDIDARKHIEEELHVMRRRAEAAVVARSELLANVSHELRSPVHCISGFAQLLADTKLDPKQQHYVQLIRQECTHMARHVEDLLQLAALEAGGARLERRGFDLEETVRGVVESERTVASKRGLALELKEVFGERWVEGDPLRVGQVLRNLIDNAIKFTEQGHVRVEARSQVEGGHVLVTLEVQDTGPGMDARDVARLMEPFQQGSTTSKRRHGGVGLGLAIVQRLIMAMDGRLEIESAVGEGTRVRVLLPLAMGAGPTRAHESTSPEEHRGERALVVDDSAPARELIAALLARLGYQVVEADSGAAALALATEREFDLVLLDYQMPNADGAEVAVALRRIFAVQRRKPQLVLLTANVFVREQLASASWAIDGILEKPLSREALAAMISRRSAKAEEDGSSRRARIRSLIDLTVVDDLRTLRNREGAPLLPSLVQRTAIDQEAALAQLEAAARAADFVGVARLSHIVAGHAALLGARTVARRARALEQRAEGKAITTAESLRAAEVLGRSWARAHEALRSLIS